MKGEVDMIALMAPVGAWELLCCGGMLLVLIGGGIAGVLLLRRRSAGEPRCGQCGYSVRGLTTMTCPECGSDLREVGIVGGARRRSAAAGEVRRQDSATPVHRRTQTVMFAGPAAAQGEAPARPAAQLQAVMRHLRDVIEPVVEDSAGRIVRAVPGGFVITFDTAADGVLTGLAIQRMCDIEDQGSRAEERMDVRIGLSTGEVTLAEDEVQGDVVERARRVQGHARAGQVWFGPATWRALDRREVPSEAAGLFELPGEARPVELYRAATA